MANPVGWVYVVAVRHARKAGQVAEVSMTGECEVDVASPESRLEQPSGPAAAGRIVDAVQRAERAAMM